MSCGSSLDYLYLLRGPSFSCTRENGNVQNAGDTRRLCRNLYAGKRIKWILQATLLSICTSLCIFGAEWWGDHLNIDTLYNNCRGGDKAAEKQLFEKLSARFRLFAELKIRDEMDAQEVCQKALMIVFEKHSGIDFETSFAAWAHKVLHNEILKYYRTEAYRGNLFLRGNDDNVPPPTWTPNPELKRRMVKCIKLICRAYNRYGRVLNLKYQGYTAEEICERLDITPSNFYTMVSRSRLLLDTCLETGDIR